MTRAHAVLLCLSLFLILGYGPPDRIPALAYKPLERGFSETVGKVAHKASPLPTAPPCSSDTALVGKTCMDLYEAPNQKGVNPIVMASALDAEAWCSEHGKRLCTEIEWTNACQGPKKTKYPYGPRYRKGTCNDSKTYIGYNQSSLGHWPGPIAQRETLRLWQGEPSGAREACVSDAGVYDLTGNVEEWTRSNSPYEHFRHVLKGRFWSGEWWTCQERIFSHADNFRFYETGFRCCSDSR